MEYTLDQLKNIIRDIAGYVVIYKVCGEKVMPILYTDNVPGFSGLTETEYLDLYGNDAAAVVLPADMPALGLKLEKLVAGEGEQEATYRTFHKTKGFVWTHVFFRLLGSYDGNKVILGNYADASEASIAPISLLDNSNQKIYVIERDTYDLLYANSVARSDKTSPPRMGQTCYQYVRHMSREFQDVLFEPFTQENREDTDEMHGSGLGLAITRRMVDAMDGDISVDSEPGRGTTFHLDLLLECVPADAGEERGRGNENLINSLDGRHILLCEDHPLNQEIAKAILQEQNAMNAK